MKIVHVLCWPPQTLLVVTVTMNSVGGGLASQLIPGTSGLAAKLPDEQATDLAQRLEGTGCIVKILEATE